MLEVTKQILGVLFFLAINLTNAIIDEKIVTGYFQHQQTHQHHQPKSQFFMIFFKSSIIYVIASLYNRLFKINNYQISIKDVAPYSIIIIIASFCMIRASQMTSFLLVLVARSSRVLAVIIIALLFGQTKNPRFRLTKDKIWWGLLLTVGTIIFSWYDIKKSDKSTETSLFGIIFLISCILMEGLTPEFRAKIKQKYSCKPTQITAQSNKCRMLITMALIIFYGQLWTSIEFMYNHPEYAKLLFFNTLISFLGQVMMYYLINLFKQHIVPFIGAFRKILSTVLSIILFNHNISAPQVIGLSIVSFVTIREVYDQIKTQNSFQSGKTQKIGNKKT